MRSRLRRLRRRLGLILRPILRPLRRQARRAAEAVRVRLPSPALDRRLAPLVPLLPARRPRLIVFLTAAPGAEVNRLIRRAFAGDRVYVVCPPTAVVPGPVPYRRRRADTLASVQAKLVRFGPPDVIWQLQPLLLDDLRAAFGGLFFHLRRGGCYVVDRRTSDEGSDWAPFLDTIDRLAGPVPAERSGAEREMAHSMGEPVITKDVIAILKTRDHHLKLREDEAEDILRHRRGVRPMAVIDRRAGGSFRSRATVHHHGADRPPVSFEPVIEYPPLTTRSYRGRIAMAGSSLLFTDRVLLPESFRYYLAPTMINHRLSTTDRHFAHVPRRFYPTTSLSGSYFHADSAYAGHFGHAMSEVVSRLWGWEQAKAVDPELKVIYRSANPDAHTAEHHLLTGFGIEPDDIVAVDRPVYLRSVFSATPMWHNQRPHAVHPDLEQVWARLRHHLVRPPPAAAKKIFVSRPVDAANRPCANTAAVEQHFAAYGFAVVYPERHSLAEQASIFAAADVVAGFAGSGLFNVLFCPNLTSLIILTHEAYTARNEYLFASVLGCELHYLWSAPDRAHPRGRWTSGAFQSSWSFDFDRHRDTLGQIL